MKKVLDENMLHMLKYLYFCSLLIISIVESNDNPDSNNNNNNNTIICTSDTLIVKMNNIYISEILNITCMKQAKFVELFALETLVVDEDFDMTGHKVQLSIIAPKWEVIDERKIVLNGRMVTTFHIDYAASGIVSFKDGKPGKPGDSAGCFLGIGNEFINGENLQIHVDGGIGGPGQFGGNGIPYFQLFFLT